MEVGYTYSTRSSRIDADNYSKSNSHTGSFSWYFLEMSALELSYTDGEGILSVKSPDTDEVTLYISEMQMYGADLVVSFAKRDSFFQPFVKGGVAALKKRIFRKLESGQVDKVGETDGFEQVPSYGVGFKIMITKTMSLKASYDRWRSSKQGDSDIWDEAVRAGMSWMF